MFLFYDARKRAGLFSWRAWGSSW